MRKVVLALSILFILLYLQACDSTPEPSQQTFHRLLGNGINYSAIDFIEKSDGSGYLVLANYIDLETEVNQLSLLNLDENGYLLSLNEINTSFNDIGVRLKEYNGHIYILANRVLTNSQFRPIFIQTDLNGIPTVGEDQNYNIKSISYSGATSVQLRDFMIESDNLILTGRTTVDDDIKGPYNECTLIYTNFNSANYATRQLDQPDVKLVSDEDGIDEGLILKPNRFGALPYELIGITSTGVGATRGTLNIKAKQFNGDGQQVIYVTGTATNDEVQSFAINEITDEIFVAGLITSSQNIFSTILDQDRQSKFIEEDTIKTYPTDFGNRVLAAAYKPNGNIIIATGQTISSGADQITISRLLKLSATGEIIDEQAIEFAADNDFVIKKIMCVEPNSIVLLSDVDLGNNANVVGFTKVIF